ncbi:uncharacterized protein LOC135951854 isoform X2 [Calliphora vicina]|uniref:uncharacterized protein LOC135951854 isoform X2 n=1 Tax=Calliphora vicina TaxID=7373 RepID=UPI00325B3BFF
MGLTPHYYINNQAENKMPQQQNTLKIKRSFKRRRFMENILCVSMAIIVVMTQQLDRAQAVPAMGSGYLRLYGDIPTQQVQQQQLWHQRYIRDVGASLSASLHQQQQQQKENLKDSLQQSSSTEVSLEQPQDCQKDGKTYLNGDKLVDPETPCTVCYCQGGEILCSSVTCFHRDDCTPKYIPGVCCPEYDNCPVATSESTANKTLAMTSTTSKPEIHQAENNPKITIKEITKPIEIRITDDNKAIPIHQMLKPSTTSTTTTTTTTPSTTSTTSTTTVPPPTLSTTIYAVSTTPTPHHTDAINLDHNQQTGESFEYISTDNHQHKNGVVTAKGQINSGDTLKLSASVAYPSTASALSSTFSTSDSSLEVEDPVPALSVFSTQGLPEDPSKVNIKREYFITTEGVASGAGAIFDGFGSGEYPNSELIYTQSAQGQQAAFNTGLQQSSAELDPDTAGSDNIYHIILTTDGPRLTSTSENYLALKGVSTTEGSPFDDLSASSLNPLDTNNNLDTNNKDAPTTEGPSKQDYYHKPSTESAQHQHLDDEDSAIPPESNPAYPSLPEDDFSLRDNNFQINDSDDVGDEPRSIGGIHSIAATYEAFKSTKHLDDHTYGSGSGSGSGMLLDELVNIMPSATTEGSGGELMMQQQSTENYDKMKSAEVIQLMYSAEDSSEETRITNTSDFKMAKDMPQHAMKLDDTSLESAEARQQMEFEMGSGSGEIKFAKQQKEREPTTARPNKKSADIDIDGMQDASGNGPQEDPKLDVESLKLDETADDAADKAAKNNILSVKIQPAQDKQLHDDLH